MFQMRIFSNRKDKRVKAQRVDLVKEQVKKMMSETDQKLILMVRG